jgi:lipid A ethanolaminephosphotransferase
MLGIPARLRPMLRVETVVLLVAIWLVATANGPWWSAASAGRAWNDPASWLFFGACFVAIVALHFALVAPFAARWSARPLLSLIVVTSAAAAHYMRDYAVIIDPGMVQNVLNTDGPEVAELLSWSLASSVVLWSILPLALIWLARIERRPWIRTIGFRVGSVAAALLVALGSILLVSRDVTSLMRNQRELRYLITPANYLYGFATSELNKAREAETPKSPVGADAHMRPVAATAKPRLFVLVVGETARAANFSLLGYARQTTPALAALGAIGFPNVTSCGTSTEVSVPCMFSPFGRADYDEKKIRGSEGLLDVLVRARFDVRWIDNQSGCKGVCKGAGIRYMKLDETVAPDLCADKECHDEILVRALGAQIAGIRSDTVIVLHMMGNHGPAYFHRYPAAFRHFTPDCATAELRKCSREEIVNAYDNAVLYTDHVLAGVVETLQTHSGGLDAAMLYVSDHGESLGENGLYLHGLPYSIAPETQKHVPMVAWISPAFAADRGVNVRCLRGKSTAALSHDNLFHSVLGLLDVETSAYRPARDVFEDCRAEFGHSYAQTR